MDTYTPSTPSILIVASNPLARMGLAALLTDHAALHIVGQSAVCVLNERAAPAGCADLGFGLGRNGRAIADAHDYPVLALVEDATRASEAWGAGVRGLIPRDANADVIASAAVAVAGGLIVLHPSFSAVAQATQTPTANAGQLARDADQPRV